MADLRGGIHAFSDPDSNSGWLVTASDLARVSVTDRCDLRSSYCMAEKMTFLPRAEVLSLKELDRICSAFIEMGVEKLRVTGGEPLVRRDVMAGIAAAQAAGLRVKINTVALKG